MPPSSKGEDRDEVPPVSERLADPSYGGEGSGHAFAMRENVPDVVANVLVLHQQEVEVDVRPASEAEREAMYRIEWETA